jgi:hypothetical protein
MPAATPGSPRPLTVMTTACWPATACSTAAPVPAVAYDHSSEAWHVGESVGSPGESSHVVAAAYRFAQDEPPVAPGRSEHRDPHVETPADRRCGRPGTGRTLAVTLTAAGSANASRIERSPGVQAGARAGSWRSVANAPLHLVGDDVGDALARADQQDASLRMPVVTSALTQFVPVDPCSDRGGDLQRAVLWGMVAGFNAGDDFQCGDVCLAPFSLLLAD